MLRTYLTFTVRRLIRNRATTFINVSGLALGLACSLLIGLFIADELSFDRHLPDADRLYRVTTEQVDQSDGGNTSRLASTFMAVGPAAVATVQQVELAVRLNGNPLSSTLVSSDESQFYEDGVFSADAGVFELFGIDLVVGNRESALDRPNTVVVSEAVADKHFGDENPLGRSMSFYGRDYEVTGVMRALPPNTHVRFELLSSMATTEAQDWWEGHEWGLLGFHTYMRLRDGADPEEIAARLNGLAVPNDPANPPSFHLQAVPDIHLRSRLEGELNVNGDIRYVRLFGTVTILVFLIACINYMNLATALASRRATEIGVRKAVGAGRKQIAGLLQAEAVMTAAIAFVCALFLVEAALPWFNALTGKTLDVRFSREGIALAGVTLAAGFFAGSYPAWFLSGFHATRALKGAVAKSGGGRGTFRKALVVLQFTVSIALITATIVVQRQLDFVQTERIGFDKEQLVVLHSTERLGDNYATFKSALESDAGVASVTTATNVPGQLTFNEYAMRPDENEEFASFYLTYNTVDFDFVRTMGVDVVAGRDLSSVYATDLDEAILVNESTTLKMGWEEPLGKELFGRKVVGVVRDYMSRSSREEIKAATFAPSTKSARYVVVRLSTFATPEVVRSVEAVWNRFVPDAPLDFSFVDADIEALYRSEQRLGKVFISFSLLAILIASLGLFGLAAFSAEQRTKEIGIRKVLGASLGGIVALLSREFVALVLVAFAIGAPLAWLGMRRWLDDYAYRIDFGFDVPLGAGALAMLVAIVTVSYHAAKAALADPARTLRME